MVRRTSKGYTLAGLAILLLPWAAAAEGTEPAPRFQAIGPGWFSFDTGQVKGKLRADGQSQGIPTLMETKSGTELAYGGSNPGILSYYRLLGTGQRFGDTARDWPKTGILLPDGRVRIHWPAGDDHPFELTATYQWKAADTLDMETTVKAHKPLPRFEVFLSSYFSRGFRSEIYLAAGQHTPGPAQFLAADSCPLTQGTYLAFPRDRLSARMIYDGRWDCGPNPVHWSVTRFLAAPLAIKRQGDGDTGFAFVFMARTQDCFAIETPYSLQPPDGVAGHFSLYASLFGQDLKPGQEVTAVVRLVMGFGLSSVKALALYEQFLQEHPKTTTTQAAAGP